jgi:hypothetical protein
MQRDTNYILSVFSGVALMLLTSSLSFGQDTSATWMYDIKLTDFKVSNKIADIPKQFYGVMSICCKHDIVVKAEDFKSNCVGSGTTTKLNWVAKGKGKQWAISISYGGLAYYVVNYFFDYDNGKLNVNGFVLLGRDRFEMPFEQMITSMHDPRNVRKELDYDFKYDKDCKENVKYHRKRKN